MSSSSSPQIVRDNFVATLRSFGITPQIRVADEDEFRNLLRERLRNLACEVAGQEVSGGSGDDLTDKLVDVLDIVSLLAAEQGLDEDQLEKIRAGKEKDRGGFEDRIVWSGNLPDDDKS